MIKLKKTIISVLVCCIAISLCLGCGGKSKDDNKPDVPPEPTPEEIVAQDYYIVAQDQKTVNWAAKELKEFTEQMNGKTVEVYRSKPADKTGFAVYLGTSEWAEENFADADLRTDELENDGFALVPVAGGLIVTSNIPRGVSYGVYELLERNGVRFYASYELGTFVPENGNVNYRLKQSEISNPDFGYREIFNDTGSLPVTAYGKEEIARLYTYLYRNRYNASTGHGPVENYEAVELFETLGFEESIGGHKFGFPDTNQHPEWRRTDINGNKVTTGNFCVSQPEALMYVAQRALDELYAKPHVKRIQVLGEDVYDGSWCYCDDCIMYTPNQQLNMVVQVMAEKIAEKYPDVIVQNSLYHDTLDVSDISKCNMENVQGFYWPRERCLAHDLQNDTCEKSVTYRRYLETMCSKFKTNSFCGYYGDMVLYNGLDANANAQVAADLKFAKEAGCDDCANLMFSMYGTTQSDEMMMTFALCQWNVDADWKSYVEGYYKDLFGMNKKIANEVMDLRYEYTEKMFSFCGYEVDYGIEGIIMSDGEQEWGKKHVLMMLEADKVMDKLKTIFTEVKDSTTNDDIKARAEMKIKYAELSRLRGLAVAHITKGAYLKKFIWDQDFAESYRECYQKGIDYHLESMKYARQYDETVWGHNAYLLEHGLGEALIPFWTWKGDLG